MTQKFSERYGYPKTGIEGVVLKPLTTHADERGFFREIIRASDEFFSEGFGQWSQSVMYTGTIKAWHIHQKQVDWWFVPIGTVKAVVIDLRNGRNNDTDDTLIYYRSDGLSYPYAEFLLGDNQPAQVLKIPPGVAHGLKVLQGPAHLFYVTSREYDPDDEGRIPHNSLGYDWDKRDIR